MAVMRVKRLGDVAGFEEAVAPLEAGGLSQSLSAVDDATVDLFGPTEPYLGLEGGGPSSSPVFRIQMTGDLSVARTVYWTVLPPDGENQADAADFAEVEGKVEFAAGQSVAFFTLGIVNDAEIEPDERYTVTLNPSLGVLPGIARVSSVITNDDYRAGLFATKGVQAEGTKAVGSTAYVFSVPMNPGQPRSFDKTFGWKVSGGTMAGTMSATASDFVGGGALPEGTVTVGRNDAAGLFTVHVAADSVSELNESFTVTLLDGAAELGRVSAVILNDDSRISILATSASKPEGSGPSPTPFTFTATRSGLLTSAVSAKWSVSGLAGAGTVPSAANDFLGGVFPSGTVSFAAGETTKVITVNVAADRAVEPAERFAVTLSAPSAGAEIGTATAGAVVFNDDAVGSGILRISFDIPSQDEGWVGPTLRRFQVLRSGDTTKAAVADWTISGGGVTGTAAATASDFVGGVLPRGTVSFAPGETIGKTFTVEVVGDTLVEPDESFTVTLGNQSPGVTLELPSAKARILNDDFVGTGVLSIAATVPSQNEGQLGNTPFTFTVTRSGDTSGTAGAFLSVAGVALRGTVAASAADFAGGGLPTSGVVQFAAGQTSRVITLSVAGDRMVELNESFAVTLSSPQTGVTLGTASATATILNDDSVGTGSLSIAALAAVKDEGDSGSTPFTFTVTRSGGSTGTASALWAVGGNKVIGQASATADDFVGGVLSSGLVSFAAGQVSQTLTVYVAGDIGFEVNEGFSVALSEPQVGVTLGTASANGVIVGDDSLVKGELSIAAAAANRSEGHKGSTAFTFTVTRAQTPIGTATAKWTVTGGSVSGTLAASAADFVGGVLPSGVVTFAPLVSSQTITVHVAGDTLGELNESFTVTLSDPNTGVSLGTTKASGVILTDDFVSTISDQALIGTAAADVFVLGGGTDTVLGKSGQDLFLFQPTALGNGATNFAFLLDFSRADGEQLNLTNIDANAIGGLGNDTFSFIGTAAFSAPGQLRWEDQVVRRAIFGNVDGDATPELTIYVSAGGPVTASWFVL